MLHPKKLFYQNNLYIIRFFSKNSQIIEPYISPVIRHEQTTQTDKTKILQLKVDNYYHCDYDFFVAFIHIFSNIVLKILLTNI